MPEFSIITPVYNAAEYLNETIKSVDSQKFTDYEWLVCDDGSTDDSLQILKAAHKKNPRIRLYTQENSGVSAARNTCLKHLSGDYLMFLDADDALADDCLQVLHDQLVTTEADLLIYGWYIHQNDQLFSYVFEQREIGSSAEDRYEMMLTDPYLCGGGYPWNKIWRIGAFDKIPEFDEQLHHYEDKLWTLECLDHLNSPIVRFFNEPLYHYYLRGDSLSHTMSAEKLTQLAQYTLDSLEVLRDYISGHHPAALKACNDMTQDRLKAIVNVFEAK